MSPPNPLTSTTADPATAPRASEGLEGWLAEQRVAPAFSTYRANRLLLLGRGGAGGLRVHERLFDRPMGLFAEGDSLWMAARTQIWRLDNHLAPGLLHEGGDRLYVPAHCAVTGDVNAHELVVPTSGSWSGQTLFVNTAFSCLAGLERGSSFAPRWQPPFLERLAAEDACHLSVAGPAVSASLVPDPAEVEGAIRYQRVFHLSPANLAPYAALTFPSLAPGSPALERISGELLGLSTMAAGAMVALAIAERRSDGGAWLRSLMVAPAWRHRGIGTGLLARMVAFLASEGIRPLTAHYRATPLTAAALEPMLARLGWEDPRTELVLLEGRAARLAGAGWADRHPITPPYSLLPWERLSAAQLRDVNALAAPVELLPPPPDQPQPDPQLSLALLHDQAPVGWLLVHRTAEDGLRYSSFYAVPAHRGRARALALLHEGFRRQHAAALPMARGAIDSRYAAMLRVLRRHLAVDLHAIGQLRISQSVGAPHGSREQSIPPPTPPLD